MSLYGGGVGGVGGRVTGRGYAPACAGLEAQDSYELRVTRADQHRIPQTAAGPSTPNAPPDTRGQDRSGETHYGPPGRCNKGRAALPRRRRLR